jgi:hypothetical protein
MQFFRLLQASFKIKDKAEIRNNPSICRFVIREKMTCLALSADILKKQQGVAAYEADIA